MTTFKFYFACSLCAKILKQTYAKSTLFAKDSLELKDTLKR